MIRLVVTDLDGTLLDEHREISQEAVDIIEKWERNGGKFTFVTGRPVAAVKKFVERVKVNAPLICCNGAEITEVRQNAYITRKKKSIRLKGVRKLMERAHEEGLTVLYYSNGVEYAMGVTEWVEIRRARGDKNAMYPVQEHTEDFWESTEAEKINVMTCGSGEAGKMLRPYMEELMNGYHVVVYEDFGCEITHRDCNKAEGLEEVAELLDIRLEEIMAVGDNENDLEILRRAGIGAAVGNATREAKAAADYVCTAKNTEGVVEAIRKFCFASGEV